ncbi:MAG: GtrA family protein [Thermodesulfobacteriota bacterium]|nr:GtrA family protein [Thermodesulfobacteriota bacterium]
MKKLSGEFIRYAMVGGIAFVVDFFLLGFLTEWCGLHYLVSATIAFVAGLIVNYTLCLLWVFSYRNLNDKRLEFILFSVVGIGGLILTDILMAVLTPVLHGQYLWAKAITACFVLLWNFFLRRQLLFARNPVWKVLKQHA